LSKEVDHIQDFTLDQFKGVDSRITEIATMNDSLLSAVDALKSFEKYVPRELVKNIIQSEGTAEIGGREVELTLMFTDIENFTTISEKLTPSELMAQLSEYFDALTGIISGNGGTIDKYIGDAIMAFWGAPSPVEDSALAACRTALACQQRLDELNLKWQKEGRPLMPTRIGIHSGKAIVGNVGSRDHINYSAIGDNVNVASRLEGLNKQFGTKILISEATYLQVKSHIDCVEIGETQVKGRLEPVKVYEPVTEILVGSRRG
jgi:adenylate cyclase